MGKPKNYRHVRPIPGTIFDKSRRGEPGNRERRCGMFFLHGVNPAGVAQGSVDVEMLDDGKVRVYYEAIYLAEGEAEWPRQYEGHGLAIPHGVWCEHGGYAKRHKVKQIRSFDAFLTEVL